MTPFPNVLYALDLAQPGAPVKWNYDPMPVAAAQGVACCDVVNRGAAYADGSVFFNTLDNRTIAVDAESGQRRWVTPLGDVNKGETMTMAPLVVKDKVIVARFKPFYEHDRGIDLGVRTWPGEAWKQGGGAGVGQEPGSRRTRSVGWRPQPSLVAIGLFAAWLGEAEQRQRVSDLVR